jgi:hypothetical protein
MYMASFDMGPSTGGSSSDYWEHVRATLGNNGEILPPMPVSLGARALLNNVEARETFARSLTDVLPAAEPYVPSRAINQNATY